MCLSGTQASRPSRVAALGNAAKGGLHHTDAAVSAPKTKNPARGRVLLGWVGAQCITTGICANVA